MASVVAMSEMYGQRPSEIMDIGDPYTAYCLDEAAVYISAQLKSRKRPRWKRESHIETGGNKAVIESLLLNGMASTAGT